MTTDSIIELFQVQDVRKASHMMTDVPFWTKQYALLANGNFEHTRAIQKVINNQASYLEKLKMKRLQGKDEKKFVSEVQNLNNIYSQQLDKLSTDAHEYMEIEKALKSFEDKSNSKVSKLENKYESRQRKLDEQTKRVETQRKLYHRLDFSKEKAEIKQRMAHQPDVLHEAKKRIEELDEKLKTQRDNYTKHLEKWKTKMADLGKISDEFEEAFKIREEARAHVVLTALQNGVDLTMAGNYAKREAAFAQITEKRFVKEVLVTRESTRAPTFQEYVSETDKDGMFKAASAELSDMDINTNTRHSDDEPEDTTKTPDGNKRANEKTKTSEYVVLKAYEKKEINQLNLKLGEHVTQLLPANADGFAFGQIYQGLLHRKKKGFYPVSNVAKLQEADGVKDIEKPERKSARRNKNRVDESSGIKGDEKSKRKSARQNEETVEESTVVKKIRKFKRKEIIDEDQSKETDKKQAWEIADTQTSPTGGAVKQIGSEARRRRREANKKSDDLVVEFI